MPNEEFRERATSLLQVWRQDLLEYWSKAPPRPDDEAPRQAVEIVDALIADAARINDGLERESAVEFLRRRAEAALADAGTSRAAGEWTQVEYQTGWAAALNDTADALERAEHRRNA